MTIIFKENKENAMKAGFTGYITETGAYEFTIKAAFWKTSTNGNKYLEINGETLNGESINFLNIYYQNANVETLQFGTRLIHALMGLVGVKQLTTERLYDQQVAPELTGKIVGVFVQKRYLTKMDGTETSSLNVLDFYDPQTLQTFKERETGANATRIEFLLKTVKDAPVQPTKSVPAPTQEKPFNDRIPF